MSFTIVYHRAVVEDDMPRLGEETKKRIRLSIEQKLTTHPDIFGKPLRRSLAGYRKLRIGDYRVIFRIEKQTVKILLIAHRSVVYEQAAQRS